MITFDVIDPKTREYPDLEEIARTMMIPWRQMLCMRL